MGHLIEEEILTKLKRHLDKGDLSIEALAEFMIERFDNPKESWLLKIGEIMYYNKIEKEKALSNLIGSLQQHKQKTGDPWYLKVFK